SNALVIYNLHLNNIIFTTTYIIKHISFFFQAEDGIRNYKVTGVQTCALPIWEQAKAPRVPDIVPNLVPKGYSLARILADHLLHRSEERRVGKECSVWWSNPALSIQKEEA